LFRASLVRIAPPASPPNGLAWLARRQFSQAAARSARRIEEFRRRIQRQAVPDEAGRESMRNCGQVMERSRYRSDIVAEARMPAVEQRV
jgi:hypothetical protein